jgi:hypothetical protein
MLPAVAVTVTGIGVVKLNTDEKLPLPQVFTPLTRQKCCVPVASATFDVHEVVVSPVAEATIFVKPASVATWISYVVAPAAADHVNVGVTPAVVEPLVGLVSVGVAGSPFETSNVTI